MAQNGPLAGVRVLDCSTMIAAPTTAAMLADFGADVVKLERPGSGDHVRRYGAQKNGVGLYWKALGRNKKSVALDLHGAQAQELLLRWLPQFDVFIENFRPGTLERWNLGPDRLLAAAPHLVILRMTAFGQHGPYRDRAGFGTLAEAMTGIAAVSGYDDRPPLLPAFPLADVMAGQAATAAVCAAYARRLKTGDGEVIDFAIYEAVMKLVESQLTEYAANGTQHRRMGNRLDDTAPRGCVPLRRRRVRRAVGQHAGGRRARPAHDRRRRAGRRPALSHQRRPRGERRGARRADRRVLRDPRARRRDRRVHPRRVRRRAAGVDRFSI